MGNVSAASQSSVAPSSAGSASTADRAAVAGIQSKISGVREAMKTCEDKDQMLQLSMELMDLTQMLKILTESLSKSYKTNTDLASNNVKSAS